jgi:hypothetical protein
VPPDLEGVCILSSVDRIQKHFLTTVLDETIICIVCPIPFFVLDELRFLLDELQFLLQVSKGLCSTGKDKR